MNDKTKKAANWLFGTDSYTPYPEVEEHEENPPALFSAESREKKDAKQPQLFSEESKALKAKIESGQCDYSLPIKPFVVIGVIMLIAFIVFDSLGASWLFLVLAAAGIVADAFLALLFFNALTPPGKELSAIFKDLHGLKLKSKIALIITLVILSSLAAGAVAIARNIPKIGSVDYTVSAKELKISQLDKEKDDLENDINSKHQILDAIDEFQRKSTELNAQLADVQAQIDASNTTLQNLTTEAQTKQGQIEQLNLQISQLQGTYDAAKAQGITLGSGFFYGGKDISVGTYTIVHVSGSGNVFVHNAAGRSVVNEMFGNGSYYIKEFKNCPIGEGYEIEISGCTVKFVPA